MTSRGRPPAEGRRIPSKSRLDRTPFTVTEDRPRIRYGNTRRLQLAGLADACIHRPSSRVGGAEPPWCDRSHEPEQTIAH